MMALLLAVAVAAEPIRGGDWLTPYDYPARALQKGRGGITAFRLTVGAKGQPVRCELMSSSGHADLDRLTCKLIMKRARFKPATDLSGMASLAVYHSSLNWWVSGMPKELLGVRLSDLILTVARLPEDIAHPAVIEVGLVVSADGRILDCSPAPIGDAYSGERRASQLRAVALLGKTACTRATLDYQAKPGLDENSRPAISVQTIRVAFTTNETPTQ